MEILSGNNVLDVKEFAVCVLTAQSTEGLLWASVCVFVSCEMKGCVLGQCETQHKCMSLREYEYAVMHSFFFSVLPTHFFSLPLNTGLFVLEMFADDFSHFFL